ncbi:MAG: hypothetical protein FJY85_19845 [Deltaproteobacteria bacterium]|nr:hypothetical protein [Deltaproteobacteria bacterium]
MKRPPKVLAALLAAVAIFIEGCVPGLRTARTPSDEAQGPPTVRPGTTESGARRTQALSDPDKGPPFLAPQERPPATPRRALPPTPRESLERDEINSSAQEFAKGVPDVQHIKTCFSKVFGGWYLHLYVKKGKQIALQHYTWNPVTKEWEVSLAVKELPVENLEHHLRGEIEDERCTVLK